jgi:signal transduction histidine kinase
MSPHRSSLLLVLLVAMPLALLAWLGTYLHTDGERRARTTRDAIVTERLQVANHQLLSDFKLAVRQLDQVVEAATATAEVCPPVNHAWMQASFCQNQGTQPVLMGAEDKMRVLREPMEAFQRGARLLQERGGQKDQDFEPLGMNFVEGWKAFRFGPVLAPVTHVRLPGQNDSGLLVREGKAPFPELIHWHLLPDGRLHGALLDSPRLFGVLFEDMPPTGLKALPGRMSLIAGDNKVLHSWGLRDREKIGNQGTSLACSLPFYNWKIDYTPGGEEFPSAALFPILLGVSSGSLLVPSLAWLYFRESSREIRVAQQRVSFVNQVSHELKTPLTNIRLYAEMARTGAENRGDAATIRQLAVVESETARLSRLIQNVLNFARKQRDRLSVNAMKVELAVVINRVAEQWRPVLEKRGITLEVDMPDSLPLQTDADAVEQILGNLLSNAEKYAADGQWVGIQARLEGKNNVLLIVSDHGSGIPAGKQELIFEPFERLRSDLREGVSGTGIGLTISRELAGLLGGSLYADATCREGARFVLCLPRNHSSKESQS